MGAAEQHIDSKMGRRGRESRGQNWGNKSSFGVYFSTDGGSFDSTHYAVEDIGEMPESIMITCTAEIGGGDGTVCMVGGDMNDYHAGYMVFATQGSIWFCVQMNANGSDGPIMSDRTWSQGDVVDICAQYRNGFAQLYVDGDLVAEGERNWVPAYGGLISLKTGSHNGDEPKDDGDGIAWVSDLNVCRNGGRRFNRFKRVIAKFDDYVDGPECNVCDAGEMYDGIIMSCQAGCFGSGTMLHYGGNADDPQAGYILYYSPGQFIWGIQMCANGSGPCIVLDGYPEDEYSVCGTYKNGYAQLWIDDELAAEQEDVEWCMAEGGALSLLTGSHVGGKDDAPDGGPMWIADVYIATR